MTAGPRRQNGLSSGTIAGRRGGAFPFEQRGPAESHLPVIEQHQTAAYEPTGRIAHGDGDNLVADEGGHDVQIDLPEHHKGEQHVVQQS